MESVWLNVLYPSEYTIDNDGSLSLAVGSGSEMGKRYVIHVPRKSSYVDLCHKLEQKLKIDAHIYEMKLRCPSTTSPKDDPFPPLDVVDDESVQWLIANCHDIPLYVTLQLKTKFLDVEHRQPENFTNHDDRDHRALQQQPDFCMNDNVIERVGVEDVDVHDVDVDVAENVDIIHVDVDFDSLIPIEQAEIMVVEDEVENVVDVDVHNVDVDENVDIMPVDENVDIMHVDVDFDSLIPIEQAEKMVVEEEVENVVDVDVHNVDVDENVDIMPVDVDFASSIPIEQAENMGVEEEVENVVVVNNRALTDVDRRGGGFFTIQETSWVRALRIPVDEDFHLQELFESKRHLKNKLEHLAVKWNFVFKSKKSNKKVYRVWCKHEGCKWRLTANRLGESQMFQVIIYVGPHSCSQAIFPNGHPNASYKMVASLFADRFLDPDRIYKTKDIMHDFEHKFGYELTYSKAHSAKTYARELIQGNPEESYALLPKFCHALELANPGTLTFIETHTATFVETKEGIEITTVKDDVFLYCFMALGQCIHGYRSVRPVISVDGTFLKGRYKGTLLVATTQDANHQIYPLAWAIVDSENNRSWTWFFEKLKIITNDSEDISIISDRADSIKHGFEAVYKNTHHGFCTYHIKRNLNSKFQRCELDDIFKKASRAYTIGEFRTYFDALCLKNEGIRNYLGPETFRYWARAHFEGSRYNIMTTNNAESINALLKSIRYLPVVALLKGIRDILQKWFADRHRNAYDCDTVVSPKIEERILRRYTKMQNEVEKVNVIRSGELFEVVSADNSSNVVDLNECKCTCRKFDLDRIPCVHALAAAKRAGKDFYDLCTPYYYSASWRQSYALYISPITNENEIQYPEAVLNKKVVPPPTKKQSGCPPNQNRKKSAGEVRNKKEIAAEKKKEKAAAKKKKEEDAKKKKEEAVKRKEEAAKRNEEVAKKKKEEAAKRNEEVAKKKKEEAAKRNEDVAKKKKEEAAKKRKMCMEVERGGETSKLMVKIGGPGQDGEEPRRHEKYASIASLMK